MLRHAVACSAVLAAACSLIPLDSNLKLVEAGYSIDAAPLGDEFTMRVHVNELRQRTDDLKSAEFYLFVAERLKRHGLCPSGWEEQVCAKGESCVQRTESTVTVLGRCAPRAPISDPAG